MWLGQSCPRKNTDKIVRATKNSATIDKDSCFRRNDMYKNTAN